MKWFAKRLVLALAALAVTALTVGPTHASCGSSNRTSHRSSECLEASWKNRSWPSNTTYSVQNECASWGKVVAKIDIRSKADKTLHLDDATRRTGDVGPFRINWIYCCSDISELCNKSDVLTSDNCNDEFSDSPAATRCSIDEDETKVDSHKCVFDISCEYTNNSGTEYTLVDDEKEISYPDADILSFCRGILQTTACIE